MYCQSLFHYRAPFSCVLHQRNPSFLLKLWLLKFLLKPKLNANHWALVQTLCGGCSVTKSCPTLCNPVDCNMPGFPVLHCLPEFARTHVHWVSDAIQPSHPLLSPSPLPSIFPSIRVFSNDQLLASGGQSFGVPASASTLPMNIQGWFPLGLTSLILLSKGLSIVLSNTTVQEHQFFGMQLSL